MVFSGCELCSRALVACLMLAVFGAQAQSSVAIHPFAGLELGYGTYSFEQKLDQTVVFPVANLTGGLAYQRFNLAANISGSLQGAEVSEEDFIGEADRQDFDVTMGYQVNSILSVFIGYKSGETNLDLVSRNPNAPATGNEYYKQKGPFVGVNIGKSFPDAGKLDFSIAYADLDAENRFFSDNDGVEPGETLEFDDINGTTHGSSTGYSINLGWTMPIKGSLLFRTKLRYNRYEQDITSQGVTFNDIQEESTMLLVGVITVF